MLVLGLRDVEIYLLQAFPLCYYFLESMAGLADIIITTEIVMKTIVKLSTTVFSTVSERNKAAKIKASDIQEKVKTKHGKEIFLTFCNTLNEILVSLITNIASSVKFSVQKESMWRKLLGIEGCVEIFSCIIAC